MKNLSKWFLFLICIGLAFSLYGCEMPTSSGTAPAGKGETQKTWICGVCGYTFKGPRPPSFCPQCKAPASKFQEDK